MAAPVPGTRVNPTGKKLGDGHRTTITFAANPTIALWEEDVTPPGVDGGQGLETTSQLNVTYTTMRPRRLKTLTPAQMTAFYDPAVYPQLVAIINVPTTITVHFPDNSTLAFYGYLKSFKPSRMKDSEKPTAAVEIQPTNEDPTDCSEAGPVYTAGPGTGGCR